jgi:prepilin-type N-terminal cleavage/methylation domain-containing protein
MRRLRGFTLVEILVTLSIIAFLFGIGISVLSKMSNLHAFDASVSQVKSLFRKARNFAKVKQAPSIVVVVPQKNAVYAKGLSTVGLWHFEDLPDLSGNGELTAVGARGINAEVINADPCRGYVQQGLEFGTDANLEGRNSYLSVSSDDVGGAPLGLVISMWIYPGDFWSQRFVTTYDVTHDGFNSCYPAQTPDGVVRPNAWNHVEIYYDCRRLVITLNGVPYSSDEPSRRFSLYFTIEYEQTPAREMSKEFLKNAFPEKIHPSDAPLMISGLKDSFYGRIDEVHVQAFIAPEVYRLSRVKLKGRERVIHFTPQGRLDGEYHPRPVVIELTDDMLYEPPGEPDWTNPRTSLSGRPDAGGILERDDAETPDGRTKKITIELNGTIR